MLIECSYHSTPVNVPDNFECEYCDECELCPDSWFYFDDDEEGFDDV